MPLASLASRSLSDRCGDVEGMEVTGRQLPREDFLVQASCSPGLRPPEGVLGQVTQRTLPTREGSPGFLEGLEGP